MARCAEGVGGTRQRSSSSRSRLRGQASIDSSAPQRVHGLPVPVSAGIARESRCTSSAQPGQTQPGRQAAMPALCRIGTGAPLHFAIRVRNEFNSGCTIDGCDAVAAQEGNPWRRTGLRCIIGGECTERVVADCRANRLAGGAFLGRGHRGAGRGSGVPHHLPRTRQQARNQGSDHGDTGGTGDHWDRRLAPGTAQGSPSAYGAGDR